MVGVQLRHMQWSRDASAYVGDFNQIMMTDGEDTSCSIWILGLQSLRSFASLDVAWPHFSDGKKAETGLEIDIQGMWGPSASMISMHKASSTSRLHAYSFALSSFLDNAST